MQRLKVLGLALMAVFMLGVVVSSSASAETLALPKFSTEVSGTGKFTDSELGLIGANIKSPKGLISKFSTTKGTENRLGTFDILFEGSNLMGEPCLSLSDKEGIILVTGEWHLVHLPKEAKHILLLLLINEVHIECPVTGLLVLILQGSTILALILPIETSTTAFTLSVKAKEGKQENNEWADDEAKAHKTELLGALNGGKDKQATQDTLEITLTTTANTIVQEK